MSVQEAIEQGVYALIMEGAMNGLWSFDDADKGRKLIATYEDEKTVKPVPVYDEDGELAGFTTQSRSKQGR
jgi:hypothetical protein